MPRPMSQGTIPHQAEEARAMVLAAVEHLPARNSAEAARLVMAEEVTEERPRMERLTEAQQHLQQIRPVVRAHPIHLPKTAKETHPVVTAHLHQRRTKQNPQARALLQVPPQEAQEQQRERRLLVPLAV